MPLTVARWWLAVTILATFVGSWTAGDLSGWAFGATVVGAVAGAFGGRPGAATAALAVASVALGLGASDDAEPMAHHRWLLALSWAWLAWGRDEEETRWLVRAQLAVVYAFSGIDKLSQPAWRSGARLIQVLLEADPASPWLDARWSWDAMWIVALAIAAWQIAAGAALAAGWRPRWVAASAVPFHLFVEWSFDVGTFTLVVIGVWGLVCSPAKRREKINSTLKA